MKAASILKDVMLSDVVKVWAYCYVLSLAVCLDESHKWEWFAALICSGVVMLVIFAGLLLFAAFQRN